PGERQIRARRVSPERGTGIGAPDGAGVQLAAVVAALRLRRMLRALMWTVLVVVAGCESRPAAFSGIDCGLAVESMNAPYDVEGRECVWYAYSRGTPVRWQLKSNTIGGEPVRESFKFHAAWR